MAAARRRTKRPKTKAVVGPARTPKAVKAWLNRTVDPALDFHVERVTKVRQVTRVTQGRQRCVIVTANVVIDGVPTGVRVRKCGRGYDYDAAIVGRK